MATFNLGTPIDTYLLDCEKYEDYLDTHITTADYRYLRDKLFCRQMVLLNYHPGREVYTQRQFEAHRELIREQLYPTRRVFHYGSKIRSHDPVLIQLAAREKPNYQKTLSTIIFLTHRDKNGFEVSGFVDFEDSLQRFNYKVEGYTDWLAVYRQKTKLRPKLHDLSYYDMHKGIINFNSSANYIVQHDMKDGLTFVHRGDHKKISISSNPESSERNYIRSMHFSKIYGYVVFFDHIVRKKI